MGTTGETDGGSLMLLSARRKDEVEGELTREARRSRGECRLERSSPGKTGTVNGSQKPDDISRLSHFKAPFLSSDVTLCGAQPRAGVLLVGAAVRLVGPGVGHGKG